MSLIHTARGPIWARDYRKSDRLPVLFIHGAGGTHLHFPPQMRRLPEANAIAVDLPGHGESPAPGRTTVADYAADLLALLAALAIERAILAGHSMGGAIAQQMALSAPQRVAGLVLIGTGANLVVNPTILEGIQQTPDATLELVATWSWAKDADDQLKQIGLEHMRQMDPAIIHGDYVACAGFDVRAHLASVQVPALVMCGSVDKMTPPRFSADLVARLPDARQVMIAGGGHMLPLEQPEAVASALRSWLVTTF